jgi:hypothetical protein
MDNAIALSKKEENLKKRRAMLKKKKIEKAKTQWNELCARILYNLANQKEWNDEDKDGYKQYNIVRHSSSIGNDRSVRFGFIESLTPSGNVRVRYLPMKKTDKVIGQDSYWLTQVDLDAIAAAENLNQFGYLTLFNWKTPGGFQRASNSCGYSILHPYDAEKHAKPQECYSLSS